MMPAPLRLPLSSDDNLYQAIVADQILVPVFCSEMLEEAAQTVDGMLARRPFLTEHDRRIVWEALSFVERVAVHVTSPPSGYTVPELGEHQKDAHLFWACERGQARHRVSVHVEGAVVAPTGNAPAEKPARCDPRSSMA